MQKQYEKMFGKEYWRVVIVDKTTDRDKTHINLFFTTIPTKEFFFFRAGAEKGIARYVDGSRYGHLSTTA